MPPRPKPYFKSTDDLLSRFQLSQAYERYVRPFALPQGTTTAITPLGAIDKGKGKEKELPMREMVPPPGGTPAPPPNEAEDDDHQPGGKGERKWKNSYKHMIKTIPGQSFPSLLTTHVLVVCPTRSVWSVVDVCA